MRYIVLEPFLSFSRGMIVSVNDHYVKYVNNGIKIYADKKLIKTKGIDLSAKLGMVFDPTLAQRFIKDLSL